MVRFVDGFFDFMNGGYGFVGCFIMDDVNCFDFMVWIVLKMFFDF